VPLASRTGRRGPVGIGRHRITVLGSAPCPTGMRSTAMSPPERPNARRRVCLSLMGQLYLLIVQRKKTVSWDAMLAEHGSVWHGAKASPLLRRELPRKQPELAAQKRLHTAQPSAESPNSVISNQRSGSPADDPRRARNRIDAAGQAFLEHAKLTLAQRKKPLKRRDGRHSPQSPASRSAFWSGTRSIGFRVRRVCSGASCSAPRSKVSSGLLDDTGA